MNQAGRLVAWQVGKTLLGWLPALAWCWWTHGLLTTPEPGLPGVWYWSLYGNLGHFFLFGVAALLALLGLALSGVVGLQGFLVAFALAGAFALAEELFQASIATRSGSLLDLITGLLGAAFVLHLLWHLLVRGRPVPMSLVLLAGGVASACLETFGGSLLF